MTTVSFSDLLAAAKKIAEEKKAKAETADNGKAQADTKSPLDKAARVSELVDKVTDTKEPLTKTELLEICRGVAGTLTDQDMTVRQRLMDPDHMSGILIGMCLALESVKLDDNLSYTDVGLERIRSMLILSFRALKANCGPGDIINALMTVIEDVIGKKSA